ncbi:MAG: SDR family oxidoreductase [Hydrogenophilaceae bacterium]|jgi:NAD(P)-dependent dehydrogenase (short-subunit alcohol dehydrogenase family)|nr:SDR family oxidoreductase [Hydrogenophilaceae bacterium]
MPGFDGKSIIVTGAASGIGAAAARILAARGAHVTLADRDEAGVGAIAEQIAQGGGKALAIAADIADSESVRAMIGAAVSAHGGLDGAINSAGVPQAAKPLHELGEAEWDFCLGVNLRGMFLCLKHQVAAMLGRGGAVVAISSAAAEKGLFNSADYCASKAGVLGLVRAAAIDCAEHAIRVNALLPGATSTPLAFRSRDANPKLAGTLRVPMNRMAEPEEVAAAAIWLLSDEASYVTGACIAVDGGMGAT